MSALKPVKLAQALLTASFPHHSKSVSVAESLKLHRSVGTGSEGRTSLFLIPSTNSQSFGACLIQEGVGSSNGSFFKLNWTKANLSQQAPFLPNDVCMISLPRQQGEIYWTRSPNDENRHVVHGFDFTFDPKGSRISSDMFPKHFAPGSGIQGYVGSASVIFGPSIPKESLSSCKIDETFSEADTCFTAYKPNVDEEVEGTVDSNTAS